MSKLSLAAVLLALTSSVVCAAQDPYRRDDAIFQNDNNNFTSTDGAVLYQSICQGCHMPEGQGAHSGAGMYPKLASNSRLATPDYPAAIVLNGLHGMPSFAQDLNDTQVAAVANYVATHFGNKSTQTITEQQVKELRPPKPIVYQEG
ncbi:cytochrome c [Pseudomonas sp. PDNC002]|uniref:c-type cytochrome n=1 Tax=Pseudomonas sp. PDNC002 TaxID=2811422 RepID=UPI001966221C|nr:cytochrome c [Pseudomonas sp. PDNC002]QRY82143.1 cytochrome c [Pseudomonas sp. PDNC002]